MIDFASPYNVEWHVYRVNVDTWDEAEELYGVISVSLSKDCTDDVPLIETSSLQVDVQYPYEFEDGWYRVVANVYQGAVAARIPITTQFYQASDNDMDYYGRTINNAASTMSISGTSVLTPASDIRIRDGFYVPKDSNGALWVVNRLRESINAPVYLQNPEGFCLNRHVVYDSNDSVLSAVWGVLDAGKWCLQLDGNGIVTVMEKPKEPVYYFTDDSTRLMMPTIKRHKSKANIPNRYIVRYGSREVVATNDDPDSETSTVNVGRYIDADIDSNPDLMTGESLTHYAKRRLEELSTVSITYDYSREYFPGIDPLDIIEVHLRDLRLDGNLRVLNQQLTLDTGITLSETASEEHKYWRATR